MPLVMAAVALRRVRRRGGRHGCLGAAGPSATSSASWRSGSRLAAFLWRYASIRAVPDADGLTVRNLIVTRRVAWDEVVEVRFAEGAPWVSLELADADELAVMAVQRADGPVARAEAQRLAAARRRTTGTRGLTASIGFVLMISHGR